MTHWTTPAWHPKERTPDRLYAKRGFARHFAELADLGRKSAEKWFEVALPPASPSLAAGGCVLLGGAGFLGARLARRLLLEDGPEGVTLVSRRPETVRERWVEWLGVEEAERLMTNPKLRLVRADLSAPETSWTAEVPRIRTVFHLAAGMHALAGWDALAALNVNGVGHAVALARRDGAMLQHASTLSVFVSSNCVESHLEDALPPSDQLWAFGGYAQTKVAAELALQKVAGDVPVQMVRYGLLVPEASTAFAPDHFFRSFITALVKVGCLPERAERAEVDLTRADWAADCAYALSRSGQTGVFHVAGEAVSLGEVVDCLQETRHEHGTAPLHVVVDADFDARVTRTSGMSRALLRSAFRKSDFLNDEAARGPLLNLDLFQATDHHFGGTRMVAATGMMGFSREKLLCHLVGKALEKQGACLMTYPLLINTCGKCS